MNGKDCRKRDAATTSPMQDGPTTGRARQRSSLIPSDTAGPDQSIPTLKAPHLNRRTLRLSTNKTKLSSPAMKPGRVERRAALRRRARPHGGRGVGARLRRRCGGRGPGIRGGAGARRRYKITGARRRECASGVSD